MAGRSFPRWALLVVALLVVLIIVGIVVRVIARRFLESSEFRGAIEKLATGALAEHDAELQLRVPKSTSDAFLAVRLEGMQLMRQDKPVASLELRADLDLFPSALFGRAPFTLLATLARGGQIKAAGELSLGQALDLLADSELPQGASLELSAKEIDAGDILAIWPSLAKNSRLNLVSGRLGGRLSLGGGQQAAPLALSVRQTQWRAPALGQTPIVLPPWGADLELSAEGFATVKPIRVQTPIAAMMVEGRFAFAESGGEGATLDLKVGSSGGMMGRVAIARLFGCQKTPPRDNFSVRGLAKRPRCL